MGTATPTPSRGFGLTLSLGLVNVGVKYAPLVVEQRTKGHYVDPDGHGPVKQVYVSEKTGEVVKPVTAYDHASGLVVLDPEDRKALESERDKRLELKALVDLDSIDPLYFAQTYLLYPQKGQEAGYDLLCSVLAESGKALMGTAVLSKSTKAIMVRYGQGCLLAHVCAYDANVAWGDHRLVVQAHGERPTPDPALVEQATMLLSGLPTEFDLSAISDEYDSRLRAAIAAAAEGKPITRPEEEEPEKVLDLMEALKASVVAAREKIDAESKPKRTRKKAAA